MVYRSWRSLYLLVHSSWRLTQLGEYRLRGRKGYPLGALWRAYLVTFILNLPHTNGLIRCLQQYPELRRLCGFEQLPHRTTFNRFINRLSYHRDLVDDCLRDLTAQLSRILPDFGQNVAVDSTVVETYSNPNRKQISDPDATWTGKAKMKEGKEVTEWYFGYKYHALVDATHGIPITGVTTTASVPDTSELTSLLDKARAEHDWFGPQYVIADKGYDSETNHRAVMERNATPIIAIRRASKGDRRLHEGIYTQEGRPNVHRDGTDGVTSAQTRSAATCSGARRRAATCGAGRASGTAMMRNGSTGRTTPGCSGRCRAGARLGRSCTGCVRASSGSSRA